MEWLCSLTSESVSRLIASSTTLRLTEFEIVSFERLSFFKRMCQISQTTENYPDMFHIWTAQRNRMDVFLTLESKLPNIAKQIEDSKIDALDYPTKVLRPLEFLDGMGVKSLDPVPIQPDRFYPWSGI